MIPIGFEPMAASLENLCSIQLSYGTRENLEMRMQNAELKNHNLIFNSAFLISDFLSGWQDSNLRPPAPKAGAISRATLHPVFKVQSSSFKVQGCNIKQL